MHRKDCFPGPLGEATCGLPHTPPPHPRLSWLLPQAPHSLRAQDLSRALPHMPGCWARLGFFFPMDRLQMKPASVGGKRFLSTLTSFDDRERQFARLCRRRPSLSPCAEVITTT